MQKVAAELTMQRRGAEAAPLAQALEGLEPRIARTPASLPERGTLERLTDGQLALVISAGLFLLAAWPLVLVRVPPFQDLPNHLATIAVLQHPDRYPEFVFNGFFKTNSALFTWLLFVGRLTGTVTAARLFALLVLALGAVAYPRFVLSFGGRSKMVVSAFFVWPMVHNWFVSMGMLDFALGVPLATLLLVLANDQRQRPNVRRGAVLAALAVLTWHAHVFPLLVAELIVLLHVATRPTWRERAAQARALALPLVPASALVVRSLAIHFTEPVGAMTGYVSLGRLLPPWELFYNMWAEWFYGFTWLELSTLVPCLALGLWALYRWRDDVPMLGPLPFVAVSALYFFSPYVATNWFHVNSRFVPFFWLFALVRLPDRVPPRLLHALAACALAYTTGMGVDYVRLERDWSRFTAGIAVVPEGARLLPLIFKSKGTSENTRSLLHAWGFYVVEKHTSAPLLFAHSRSFPVMYREPPPAQFNHLVLESFAPNMAAPAWECGILRSGGLSLDDCDGNWRRRWAAFWRQAQPAFDHVLLWGAPREVVGLVPAAYHVAFQQGELTILERPADESPAVSRRE